MSITEDQKALAKIYDNLPNDFLKKIADGDMTVFKDLADNDPRLSENTNTKWFYTFFEGSDRPVNFFILAAIFKQKKILERLLSKNPEGGFRYQEVIAKCNDKTLAYCCEYGMTEAVDILLSRVTDVDGNNRYEFSHIIDATVKAYKKDYHQDLLTYAIKSEETDLARRLLTKNADGSYEFSFIVNGFINTNLSFNQLSTNNSFSSVIDLLLTRNPDGSYQHPEIKDKLISIDHFYNLLSSASSAGNLAVVKQLLRKDLEGVYEFPIFLGCIGRHSKMYLADAIKNACEHGHLEVLEYLLSIPETKELTDFDDLIFRGMFDAAIHGHLNVLEYILQNNPDGSYKFESAVNCINDYDNNMIQLAIANGHYNIVDRLLAKKPDGNYEFPQIIDGDKRGIIQGLRDAKYAHNYDIISRVIKVPVFFNYAEKYEPEHGRNTRDIPGFDQEIKALVHSELEKLNTELESFRANNPDAVFNIDDEEKADLLFYSVRYFIRIFSLTPRNKKLDILDKINKLLAIPAVALKVTKNDNELIRLAVAGRRSSSCVQSVLTCIKNQLLNKDPDGNYEYPQVISDLLDTATIAGDLDLVRSLLPKDDAGYKLPEVFCNKDAVDSGFPHINNAIENACEFGRSEILDYLLKIDQNKPFYGFERAITSGMRYAFKNNHIGVIERLLKKGDDGAHQFTSLIAILSADDNKIILSACENGASEIVDRLLAKNPDGSYEFQDVADNIAARSCFALKEAHRNQHNTIINRLLHFPNLFDHAESHTREYSNDINIIVREQYGLLIQQRDQFVTEYPTGVFNIESDEKANLLFYFARHFIRNDDIDKLNDLLAIPAIVSRITSNENELIRFAIRHNKIDCINRLLEFPQVRELTEQNNFYRAETRVNGINLRRLAQDRESSMIALNTAEQKIVDSVKNKYDKIITDKGGVKTVVEQFKTFVENKYNAKPETITFNNEKIELPFKWTDLQQLRSNHGEDFYKMALRQYYGNIFHTAYRYLLKPNPFMSPNAQYIEVNRDLEQLTGQLFRYSSFEQYIATIAYFWTAASDQESHPSNGGTVDDRKELFVRDIALLGRAHNWDDSRPVAGQPGKTEEYDDLEADKPSCYSGVNRRLFQSVHGHAIFDGVNKVKISAEVKDFVREYYKTILSDFSLEQLTTLSNNITDYFIELDSDKLESVIALNITGDKKKEFTEYLNKKYGIQVQDFADYYTSLLAEGDIGHIMKFYSQDNGDLKQVIDQISDQKQPAQTAQAPVSTTTVARDIDLIRAARIARLDNTSSNADTGVNSTNPKV